MNRSGDQNQCVKVERALILAAALSATLILGMLWSGCRVEPNCDCARGCDCVQYGDLIALQGEVKANLVDIYTSEVSYFGENNTFSGDFSEIYWYPVDETRYAYFLPGDSIQPTLGGSYRLPPGRSPAVSETGFTVFAAGNIDCDQTLDVWSINDAKKLVNWINDVTE
ncbi:MAG TPA: hypothetical protein VM658_04145 [bacterium]|nr:hypothetical protein [bacterium]